MLGGGGRGATPILLPAIQASKNTSDLNNLLRHFSTKVDTSLRRYISGAMGLLYFQREGESHTRAQIHTRCDRCAPCSHARTSGGRYAGEPPLGISRYLSSILKSSISPSVQSSASPKSANLINVGKPSHPPASSPKDSPPTRTLSGLISYEGRSGVRVGVHACMLCMALYGNIAHVSIYIFGKCRQQPNDDNTMGA